MLDSAPNQCPISNCAKDPFFQPKTVPAWNRSQDPSKEEVQNSPYKNKKSPFLKTEIKISRRASPKMEKTSVSKDRRTP